MILQVALIILCVAAISNGAPPPRRKYPGQPLTILGFEGRNSSETFDFDLENFAKILSHKDVIDRKIAIYSVVGAFRKGKSFLLDYFLRYLYTNYRSVESAFRPFRVTEPENWIGDKEEPLQGFTWKSGSKRDTSGLIVWSDVFLHDAPNGDKIAILLMDTQGLFDHQSSPADNTRIFSLSTLLSSTQIFNLFSHIQEDHLQYLQFATDFALFISNGTNEQISATPFQNLMFLIRDWNFEEDYPYGFSGGQQLLDIVLKIKPFQMTELKSVRQYIYSSFEKISCFLLPHPGNIVATQSYYDGRWSEIDEIFVEQMKDLIETTLAPENLSLKKINGEVLTVREYYSYVEHYVEMYKFGDIPAVKSIYEVTVTNHMKNLVKKSFDKYNTFVLKNYNEQTEVSHIEDLHETAKNGAHSTYTTSKKMGSEEHNVNFRKELDNLMKTSYEKWRPAAMEYVAKILETTQKINEASAATKKFQTISEQIKIEMEENEGLLVKSQVEMERVKNESETVKAEVAKLREEALRKLAVSRIARVNSERLAREAEAREDALKKEYFDYKAKIDDGIEKAKQENSKGFLNDLVTSIFDIVSSIFNDGELSEDEKAQDKSVIKVIVEFIPIFTTLLAAA